MIRSVATGGTRLAPAIVVTGIGFGSQPAPSPPYPPEGHGCPSAPPAGDGHLYGTAVYLSDLMASTGDPNQWTAGKSTANELDCLGLVIDHWSNSEVAFHFGNIYAKALPQNMYYLNDGDRISVTVHGATIQSKVHFPA